MSSQDQYQVFKERISAHIQRTEQELQILRDQNQAQRQLLKQAEQELLDQATQILTLMRVTQPQLEHASRQPGHQARHTDTATVQLEPYQAQPTSAASETTLAVTMTRDSTIASTYKQVMPILKGEQLLATAASMDQAYISDQALTPAQDLIVDQGIASAQALAPDSTIASTHEQVTQILKGEQTLAMAAIMDQVYTTPDQAPTPAQDFIVDQSLTFAQAQALALDPTLPADQVIVHDQAFTVDQSLALAQALDPGATLAADQVTVPDLALTECHLAPDQALSSDRAIHPNQDLFDVNHPFAFSPADSDEQAFARERHLVANQDITADKKLASDQALAQDKKLASTHAFASVQDVLLDQALTPDRIIALDRDKKVLSPINQVVHSLAAIPSPTPTTTSTTLDHVECIIFHAVPKLFHPVVLGIPWLPKHKPLISRSPFSLCLGSQFCSETCFKRELIAAIYETSQQTQALSHVGQRRHQAPRVQVQETAPARQPARSAAKKGGDTVMNTS